MAAGEHAGGVLILAILNAPMVNVKLYAPILVILVFILLGVVKSIAAVIPATVIKPVLLPLMVKQLPVGYTNVRGAIPTVLKRGAL